ncbi:MAG: hypothetical protein AB1689_00210 [Thermodesulfobacteriota bacterium]
MGAACSLAAVLLAGAGAAPAQTTAGTRTTPDGKQVLVSKDVGGERWAISVNLDDGTATGNVFRPGAEPKFVWCERTGDDGSLDPVEGEVRYACRGADACLASPCDASGWTDLGPVGLPGSFLLPAEDPFSPLRTPEHFCDDGCHLAEFLQVGEYSYSVDSAYCNYLTVVQETLAPIRAGDEILIRFWHFALSAPDGGRAYLAIAVGDRIVWDARLPIPCRGGIVGAVPDGDCIDTPGQADVDPARFVADFDAPAGTPIYVHVQNHGDNNYSLVEASVNEVSLVDMDAWRKASNGLPPLPPSGSVPPKGPTTCVPFEP